MPITANKNYDVIVIGGGLIGLGVCFELALKGCKPLLIDQNNRPGHFLSRSGVSLVS